MKTFQLNKLVKDAVPESMKSQGQTVKYRVLGDDEFAIRIREKIVEEALEYQESGESKELEDLLAAIKAAQIFMSGISSDAKPNVFSKRYFVETVTMEDDNSWAQYYLNDPDRFPEIIE